MLKYIFGGIFIALAWAAVLVFPETLPMWPAIVLTVAIVLGLAGYVLWRSLRSRRAASEIERALREQAQQHAGGLRPDLRGEIAAMEAEFNKAVAALKSSKLGRTGRDALGALPWYVIIGPPGSGKTTALRNSGLKFPYAAKGGSVRGVGGTRNCDWWLTNDAILLDTAGRWSTEDDDRDEWLSFLDLLKRTRPKKPVNGLVVAVSAPDLFNGEDECAALGKTLRERVDEVMGRLDMVLPVYLMVTKCDLVSGFVESFADLKDKERGQIWGFSLPLVAAPDERMQMFGERLDEVVEVAERRSWERLGSERRLEARQRIFEFPQDLNDLKKGLHELVGQLFAESVYQDAPIMRGVYFTSGTQEGRPIDRVVARMADAFGIRAGAGAPPMPAKPRSYFVKELLTRVVFLDSDVAVRSSRVLKRQRLIRYVVTGASCVAAAALLVLPISSYSENNRFVRDADAFVARLERNEAKAGSSDGLNVPSLDAMEAAEAMATRLAKIAADGPDVSMRFGLYPGDRLLSPVAKAIESALIRPVVETDGRLLSAFTRGGGERITAATALDALTLHLLITQPKAPGEPAPEDDRWAKKTTPMIGTKLAQSWARIVGAEPTGRGARAVENATRFFALRIEESPQLLDRKGALVSKVRSTLAGAGEGDPLDALVSSPSMPRPVRLVDLAGGAITAFKGGDAGGAQVPGAFTPEGWDLLRERLSKLADDDAPAEDAWILGARKKVTEEDAKKIESSYYRRYIDVWKSFLLGLSLSEPGDLNATRALMKRLTTERPLDAVWRNVSGYLVLKDESLVDQAAAKAQAVGDKKLETFKKKLGLGGGSSGRPSSRANPRARAEGEPLTANDVNEAFAGFVGFAATKPTGLDAYHQILAELLGALGEDGAVDTKAFSSTLRTQRVKLGSLVASYNQNGWESGALERLLAPPLLGAEIAVKGATADSASRKWCETVVVAFDNLLAGKYPFAKGKGVRDAAVADVEKFLAPKGGTLWQYYADALAQDLENPAGTSIFRIKDEATVRYTSGLIDFLKRAREVSDTLFAKEPAKLGLSGYVRLRPSPPYARIVFESGRSIPYFNQRERWEEFSWPARGARVLFFEASGKGGEIGLPEGSWGLFRLIDEAKVSLANDGEDYIKAQWDTPLGSKISADLKPARLLHLFKDFKIPRAIVAGAPACRN